jgi:hypothetical protein
MGDRLMINFPKSQKRNNSAVEQVFLIYRDGRLISYASLKDYDHLDEDIVGAMLTAVMTYIKVVIVQRWEGKEPVNYYRFKFGEKRLIIETRESFLIAMVLHGKENRSLQSQSKTIISDIEERYGSALVDWNGELSYFEGVDNIMLTLLPLDRLSEEEREAIREYKEKNNIFELWSKMHLSIIQDALLPKPHVWKDFNLNINNENKKRIDTEDKETS